MAKEGFLKKDSFAALLITLIFILAIIFDAPFLRNLEHRLQYVEDAQTHALPPGDAARLAMAQMMGMPDASTLLTALEMHRTLVAAQFDTIFSEKNNGQPNGEDGAPAPTTLTETDAIETIVARLAELAFDDPQSSGERLLSTLQSSRMQSLPDTSRKQLLALINACLPLIAAGVDNRTVTFRRILDFFEAIARRAAYLALLGYPASACRAQQLWRHLIRGGTPEPGIDDETAATLEHILEHGTLATRLRRATHGDPSPARLHSLYRRLADCLHDDRLFGVNRIG